MGDSVVDPRVLRGMRTFIRLALDKEKELGRGDLTICLNCHVPQIKDATPELVLHIGDLVLTAVEDKDETKREEAKKELSKLNLNCLGCHNLKALGFVAKPEETVIYGPEDVESNTHESIGFRTRRSDLISTSEFCAQCHHCPPDVPWEQCPTLYTTYIDHFVSKGRKESCQDCHMNGKERVHKFYGPNNIDFLRSALSLSVNVRQTRYIRLASPDATDGYHLVVAVAPAQCHRRIGSLIRARWGDEGGSDTRRHAVTRVANNGTRNKFACHFSG